MINKKIILALTIATAITTSMVGCSLKSKTTSTVATTAPTTEKATEKSTTEATTTEITTTEIATTEAATTEEPNVPKEYTIKSEIANGSIEDLKIQICDDIIPLGSMLTVKDFFEKYPDYRFTKKNGESITIKAEKTDEFCVHGKVEVQNDKLDTSFYLYVVNPGLEDAPVMDCSVVTVMDLNKTARDFAWYSGGYKYNEAINDDSLLPGYNKVDFWKDKVTIGTYSSNSGAKHHIVEGKTTNIYGVKPVFQINISETGHRLKDLIMPYYADIKAYVTTELQGRYLNVLRDKD